VQKKRIYFSSHMITPSLRSAVYDLGGVVVDDITSATEMVRDSREENKGENERENERE